MVKLHALVYGDREIFRSSRRLFENIFRSYFFCPRARVLLVSSREGTRVYIHMTRERIVRNFKSKPSRTLSFLA